MSTLAREAILALVKEQVIALAIKQAPFLGFKLLKPLTSLIIGKVLKIAFEETELAIYIYKINLETKKQAEAVKKAQDELQNATDENRQEKEDELKKRLADLIRINP